MSELVSVIIPVYNCEKYISDCVLSLVNQTYDDIEIILIDDGSTDLSAERCRSLEKQYTNVHYYYQKNGGAASARNNGLSHASGEFILFVDGDDQTDAELIQRLYDEMDDNTDVVCCSYEILGTNKEEKMFPNRMSASSIKEKEPFYLQLMDYTYAHDPSNSTAIGVPWGKLIRKSVIDENKIRFDVGLRRMQDNIFVMELFYSARKIIYIPEFLYLYRVDHINSYNYVSYSPEVYLGVLNRRDTFFQSHPDLITPQISDYLYKEHLNYLMMSIHYIVAKNEGDKKKKINSIKELCNNNIYKKVLRAKPTSSVSSKQKVQWTMYKLHMYSALYNAYKFKYKL